MAAKSEFHEIDTGVAEVLHEPDGSMVLLVNGVPSSHIVPGDPERLDFEYMRWIADFLDAAYPAGARPKARLTHLGGGACTLARYFAHAWPGSRSTVVEIDSELAILARTLFDVPRAPAVKIRTADAREATDGFKPATRDVIIRDVFTSATTPRSLTTVEFYRAARTSLADDGFYLANCGSHANLKEAKDELAGMCEVWPHVAAIADPPMLKGRRYGNIVLIGANRPLEASPELTRNLLKGAVPAKFAPEEWCRALARQGTARGDEGAAKGTS
ncbi:fused MFS/spermidine synthase [Corynebacterium aquatimens]|uniref:spermidine synthase n=1 Tax=Corynebacterium TaxID=1716 RepID=UPI001F3473E3|nr:MULTISPECIES: fused MFS/spermidine synthase [Corynebacterium]QYH19862.1 fused MFS/spermidine synthase [Corynebacterium aquatimens]UIZ92984.1 fused MFS/spermidine synthase [Corynebacterium sp. CNCTC7651]